MAKESRVKISSFFLFFAMILYLIGVGISYSTDRANFRVRLHQTAVQDYTAADVEKEIEFGKKVAARLLGLETLVVDEELTRYVALIGRSLSLHSSRNEIQFHFAVLDSKKVNAYSTPGGYIFITSGALQLAEDESEIAAVLAHEIAHVTERHVVDELNITAADQSGFSGMSRFLGASGNTAQVALQQAVDKAMNIIYKTGYKIEDELQADKYAIMLLAQTGYDPLALQRYLLKTEKRSSEGPSQEGSNTHPAPSERFNELAELIREEKLADLQFPRAQERFNKFVKLKLGSL